MTFEKLAVDTGGASSSLTYIDEQNSGESSDMSAMRRCIPAGCCSPTRDLQHSSSSTLYNAIPWAHAQSYLGFTLDISTLSTLEIDVDSFRAVPANKRPLDQGFCGSAVSCCAVQSGGSEGCYPHCCRRGSVDLGSEGSRMEESSLDSVDFLSMTSSLSSSGTLDSVCDLTLTRRAPPPSPCTSVATTTSPVYANLPPPHLTPVTAIFDISRISSDEAYATNHHVDDLTFNDDLDVTCRDLDLDINLSEHSEERCSCERCGATPGQRPRPSCTGQEEVPSAPRPPQIQHSQASLDKVASWLQQHCEAPNPRHQPPCDSDSSGFYEASLPRRRPVTACVTPSQSRRAFLSKLKGVGKRLRKLGKAGRLEVLAVV